MRKDQKGETIMIFIRYVMIYAVFITAAFLQDKREGKQNPKTIGKSILFAAGSSFLSAYLLPYLEQMLLRTLDGRFLYTGSVVFEVLLAVGISVGTMTGIAAMSGRRSRLPVPIWLIVFGIVILLGILNISNLKETEAFLQEFENGTVGMLELASFTPKYRIPETVLGYLPAILCGGYLMIAGGKERRTS